MAFPTGWARKVKVTIQPGKVPGTLTNYPALITEVNLPQGDNEIFDADGLHAAINGGGDIRASSDAAGSTQLPLQIVSFVTDNTPANGTCELWVKIPSVSSSVDTDFYIWWEKSAETQPAVSATFGRNNVWTEAELVVLMEDSIPVDSTGNHVLSLAGGLSSIDGPFGKANSFAGNDRLSNTDAVLTDILETYDTTVSIISKKASYAVNSCAVNFDGTDIWFIYPFDTANGNGVRIFWNDVITGALNVNDEAFAGTWLWSDFTTRASNDHELYSNGALVDTATNTGAAGPFTGFFIGGWGATAQDYNADIAMVIVWSTARDDAWLTAQYNNQFDPATFIIEGTPEAIGGAAPKTYISPLGGLLISDGSGKTYISPLHGIAIQDIVVIVGDLNTKSKRFSMLNFGAGTTPHLLPDPDGTFDLGDKQHFLDCYSGIAFTGGGASFDESISLSGQGDLTLIASVIFNALLQLNGQGDFILANTLTLEELLTLAGQGDLQVSGNLDIDAALQLDGQGNLVLTPNLAIDALANLSAQGSISFDPELVMDAALTLSSQGDMTLTDTVSFEEGVTFNSQGNLVLSVELLAEAAVNLSVDAALALLASVIVNQSVVLTGQGNVTFIGGLDVAGTLTLGGLGDITSSRTVTFDNVVALGGLGNLSVVRTVILNEPVVINAQADITADRNVIITGSIPLGGQGGVSLSTQLDAEGTITFTAQADLADVGSLTMEEIVSIAVNAALTLLATTQESSIINKINLSGVKISEIGLRGIQEPSKSLSGELDITVTLQGKVDR